jgi:hypothetical protein
MPVLDPLAATPAQAACEVLVATLLAALVLNLKAPSTADAARHWIVVAVRSYA